MFPLCILLDFNSMEIKDFQQPSNIIAESAAKEYKLTPQNRNVSKLKHILMLVSKNKTCLSIFFQLLSNASVRLYAAVILIFYKKKIM